MNPLLNPFVSIPLIRSVFFAPRKIYKFDKFTMEKYRDRLFKSILKYAFSVPIYHEKYKKSGIYFDDIKGIKDIEKLPFITKKELVDGFPDKIIPMNYDRKKGFVICTGGTTGKPVSIYTDFLTMSTAAGITIRELKYFNLHWRKSKFVHIGNFNQYRIDKIAQENVDRHIKVFFKMQNRLNIDVNLPMIDMINELNKFKPQVIMSYPSIFQHLAFLKRKGYGEDIKPKLLWTGGAILDDYTKDYVEDAFGCKIKNIYPSVEAGADIAFECRNGNWHINYDFFNIEAIDENGNVVSPCERGHVVLTRLWGKGTPIIRYTGMDDWVRIKPYEKCDCGLKTPMILNGVEGRKRANIVLPNGKIFPPGAFCFITPVLQKLRTFKVKQYQIVQKKINQIDILLVIDDDLRDVGPSFSEIAENIKEIYQKKVGKDVNISVKEVKEIKNMENKSKPPPIVISNVTMQEAYSILESKS
jgi:phenylacetate-CoA ligase